MKIKSIISIFLLLALEVHAGEKPPQDGVTKEEKKSVLIDLFDGKTLKGWKTVRPKFARFWSVKDGVITASNGDKKMPVNTYLVTTKEYEDFEFTCDFRLSGDPSSGVINSGIQYRSLLKKKKKKDIIVGYQADIGEGWWGGIFDEHRRRKLVPGDAKALLASEGFKHDNWHHYKIVCKGTHHQLFINGLLTADYTEKDPEIPSKGVIALQLHKGGVAKIEYKNIKLKELK